MKPFIHDPFESLDPASTQTYGKPRTIEIMVCTNCHSLFKTRVKSYFWGGVQKLDNVHFSYKRICAKCSSDNHANTLHFQIEKAEKLIIKRKATLAKNIANTSKRKQKSDNDHEKLLKQMKKVLKRG